MKRKIVGILICTLMIATAIPAMGITEKHSNELEKNDYFVYGSVIYSDIQYIIADNTIELEPSSQYRCSTGENLAPNPSFEEGSNMPDGWYYYDYHQGDKYTWDSKDAHSGEKSVTVSNIKSTRTCYDWSTTDLIPVDVINNDYEISVWYKYNEEPAEEQFGFVGFVSYDENKESLYIYIYHMPFSLEWSYSQFSWIVSGGAAEKTKYAKLLIGQVAENDDIAPKRSVEVRFDDVFFNIVAPPLKPETPSGPEEGDIGQECSYSTKITDPLDKQVFYMWDWGDGDFSEWLGPYNSGETVSASHAWAEKGIYIVKVKAKNTDELESEWSDSVIVGIPVKNEGTDQIQDICDGHAYGAFSGNAFAQSFIPSENTITSVMLYVNKKGNPGDLTVSIRDDLNDKDLTSILKSSGSIIEGSAKWMKFDFPDIEVNPGQTYYIVWTPQGPSNEDNVLWWLFGENDHYPNGCAWHKPEIWGKFQPSQYPGLDFCFETFHAKSKAKSMDTPFLQFLENHTHLFPLLRQLLGL